MHKAVVEEEKSTAISPEMAAREEVRAALQGPFGGLGVLPVLPRDGGDAIRVLVRAVKGGKGAEMTYPVLALNDSSNKPTEAAEAVLRSGESLPLAELE